MFGHGILLNTLHLHSFLRERMRLRAVFREDFDRDLLFVLGFCPELKNRSRDITELTKQLGCLRVQEGLQLEAAGKQLEENRKLGILVKQPA